MKSKSLILLIVSGVFGLVAAVMISQVIGKGGSSGPEITMGPVLVAMDQLDHNALLTEENVKVENWPTDIIPENAVRSFDQIDSMAISTRLSRGLPILVDDLIHKKDIRTYAIPKGFKVVSLKASADDTLDGLMAPGDKVDVVGIFKVRKKDQIQTTSKTFLKGITVFAVDSKMRRESGENSGSGKGSAIVSLLLNEAQAEQFILVEKEADLKLVLRGPDESEDEDDPYTKDLVDLSDVFNPGGNDTGDDGSGSGGGQPYVDRTGEFEQRVWSGGAFEDFTFGQTGRLDKSPVSANTSGSGSESNQDDGGDYAGIDDDDTLLEQDQYPGE